MPRGPKGEKRPADVIGAAVMVGRIATGAIDEGAGGGRTWPQGRGGAGRWNDGQTPERDRQEGGGQDVV
jgi:hypothetical protein